MPISTGKGDDGRSDLLGGHRLRKNHPRFEALGTIDEAQSAIGMVRSHLQSGNPIDKILKTVQHDLMLAMADVADPDRDKLRLEIGSVQELEEEIEKLEKLLPPQKGFILPEGSISATTCFWARTVVRRAERAVSGLIDEDKDLKTVLVYLNRLGDLMWLMGRGMG
jgi:cob(I)alamin adenosyltransferase